MSSEQALSAEVERALAAAARAWPEVELLMLFGSASRGRMGPGSDVDLLVRVTRGSEVDPEARERFLEQAVRATGREVDLVIESPSTSVILRREVAARGRPLFERSADSARCFRVEAVAAYVELEPQLRKIGEAIRARAVRDGEAARTRLEQREARGGG